MEQPTSRTGGMTLRDFIRVLRHRKWTIVISIVLFIAASVVYDLLKTPEYTATAQVQLLPQISTALLEANNSALANSTVSVDVPTDTQVFESSVVSNRVRARVKNAPSVSVTQVGITDVVNVSVTSTNRYLSARAANAYATTYIQVQQQQSVSALSNASQLLQQRMAAVQNQINTTQAQIQALGSSDTQQAAALNAQLTSLEQGQANLNAQLSNYQTAASLATGGGQVVSRATVPNKPSSPKPLEYGFFALLAGLVVGIGIASLQEYIDEKLRSVEDLESVIGDTPVIGFVPPVAEWRDRSRPYLVTLRAPKSPASEAYKSLRTSIQFLGLDREFDKLLLTSPRSSEGKTTSVANLAVTMAQSGQRVIVVDCDLRRPRIHAFFDIPYDIGFTSVLVGGVELETAIHTVQDQPNLDILPCGVIPPNPSELLASRRTHEVLDELAATHDLVLIDTPPVLPVTDAVTLAPRVDGVVMVAAAGITMRRDLRRALDTLSRVEAPLSGVVWNRSLEEDAYADYRYSYVYAPESARASATREDQSNGNKRRPAHAGALIGRRQRD